MALGLAQDAGVQAAVADWLGVSGDASYGLGRYHEAVESLRSALPTFRDHFIRRHHGLCLLKIGYAYQAMGDYQTAIRHLKQRVRIFDQLQLGHFAERAREALDTCLSSERTASDEPPRA
jgi:tetratricopeptide (TPR) repeat protein